MRKLIYAFGLAASLLMEPALADGNWYGGLGVGSTHYGVPNGTVVIKPGTFDPPTFSATFRSSDSATGWSVDFGYRFDTYFALEGGYTDFGKATATTTTTSPDRNLPVDYRARGETLDALGLLPVGGGFTLFAKAGFLHYKSDTDEVAVFLIPVTTPQTVQSVQDEHASSTGTTPDFGVGLSYAVTGRFSVRAGVTYYRGRQDSTGLHQILMPGAHLRYLQFIWDFD